MVNPLHDIHNYGKNLTITQVVKFFEKINGTITRPMVQNYIRAGLLPPPVNKRFYTHKHLAALVIIDYLKSVYGIDEIRSALLPHMDGEGLPLDTYNGLIDALSSSIDIGQSFTGSEALFLMLYSTDIKVCALRAIHSLQNGTGHTILPL
jgi:DNA-binding transcriptional MerR regulator